MSDLFRCDYCGELTPVARCKLYWVVIESLPGDSDVVTSGLFCSDPCAQWHSSRAGTARG